MTDEEIRKKVVAKMPKDLTDIEDFIRQQCIFGEYIFYDGKKNKAYCTACGSEYDLIPGEFSGMHGRKCECLLCGNTETIALSAGRGRQKLSEFFRLISYGRRGRTVWAALWEIEVNFEKYGAPEIRKHLRAIYRFNSKKQEEFKCDWGWFNGPHWHEVKSIRVPAPPCAMGMWYTKYDTTFGKVDNLQDVMEKSDLKYLHIPELYLMTPEESIMWLRDASKFKSVELLWKAGFKKLVEARMKDYAKNAVYWKADSLEKALRLPKRWIKYLRPLNPGNNELKAFQQLTEEEKRVAYWPVVREMAQYHSYNGNTYRGEVEAIMPMRKWMQYIESQGADPDISHPHFLGDYKDYIRIATMLGMDLSRKRIRFPKDLKAAHDEASSRYKAEKDSIKDAAIASAAWKTDYQDEALMVIPAMSQEDLNKESAVLNHCVHTYGDKLMNGRTWIFFIRQKTAPDIPYYTLEASPVDGHMVQCRGNHNKSMTDEVSRFTNKFISHLQKEIITERRTMKCQTA